MKSLTPIIALLLCLMLWGCENNPSQPTSQPTQPASSPTFAVTSGWTDVDGRRAYYDENGIRRTGWLDDAGQRYYLDEYGLTLSGMQQLDGKDYYFRDDGSVVTGWLTLEQDTFYFGMDGSRITGLMNIAGKGYYFSPDGCLYRGWLTLEDRTYHFDEQGIMAVGPREIDGRIFHFTPRGICVPLVNPWNPLPEDYQAELVYVTDRDRLETSCAEALEKMLTDLEAAGYEYFIASAYRTQEEQEFLFDRKLNYYLELDMPLEEARTETAKSIAIPGTSEHQLGLAVDICDLEYGILDDFQANTGTQKWLMEHCHEYGFILRYPKDTTHITGIIYEPWHYRYVGIDIAREITNLGITLEEYLGAKQP